MVRQPKVKAERELDYPLSAQLNRVEGNVLLGVFVDNEGKALEVQILQSSGHDDLDDNAVDYAMGVPYEPGLIDGNPVEAWTKLLLRYKLTDVPFEENEWLRNVRNFQDKAQAAPDSIARYHALRKLYAQYHGLSVYVDRHQERDINPYIKLVVSDRIIDRWYPFWDVFPVAFAVFDDFWERYPNIAFRDQVYDDLVDKLVEAKYQIQIKAIQSSRFARKSIRLSEMIDQRIAELTRPEIRSLSGF